MQRKALERHAPGGFVRQPRLGAKRPVGFPLAELAAGATPKP